MPNPDFTDILSAFIAEKVEFLVVGGYAMAFHGYPVIGKLQLLKKNRSTGRSKDRNDALWLKDE